MTDEAKALVERLRWGAWYYEDQFDGKAYASDDPLEAADLIETQAREIERLTLTVRKLQGNQAALEAELAKFKALAETLAGAVKALMPTHINLRMPHPDDSFIVPLDVNMGELRALDAALRKWEEARDAS